MNTGVGFGFSKYSPFILELHVGTCAITLAHADILCHLDGLPNREVNMSLTDTCGAAVVACTYSAKRFLFTVRQCSFIASV